MTPPPYDVLLIGGRSGVGKTSVGYEVSAQLQAAGVAHCVIEGDNLDAAYPKPADDPYGTALTAANLGALWANYTARGFRRLVYTNTVSVLEAAMITSALGGACRLSRVLLTATDETARERLSGREIGSELERHLRSSAERAVLLEREAPAGVVRVATDGRTVAEVAAQVLDVSGWLPATAAPERGPREPSLG